MTDFKNRIVGLEYIEASKLKAHPKNWRVHPEDQRSLLEGVLDQVGIADALLAYTDKDGQVVLIDGHLRRDLTDQVWPVLMTDLDEAEAQAVLATHDVVTTMAVPDEDELVRLLDSVQHVLSDDILRVIDPDIGYGDDGDDPGQYAGIPKYPIQPQLDEGYDYVVIFAMKDSEAAWLHTQLELPEKRDKTKVGTSRVLTVPEFRRLVERWQRDR
jgi:hypothetical protein